MSASSKVDALTVLRRPYLLFSRWPLRFLTYEITSIALALAGGVVLLTLVALPLWALLFAAVERRRGRILGYPALPSLPREGPSESFASKLLRLYTDPATWRAVLSLVLSLLFGFAQLALLVYSASIVVFTSALPQQIALYRRVLEETGFGFVPMEPIPTPGGPYFQVTDTTGMVVWIVIAAVVVVVLCSIAAGLAVAQVQIGRVLLSTREADLEQEVTELEGSRSTLLDSFEDDRARIERDLHDGAQQHLVLTSLLIGTAARQMKALGDDAATLTAVATLEKAQSSAELALSALRTTVLGFYTDVLSDHGLPVAVEELAHRSTIPVQVRSTLSQRLPATVERCAYFVVSEALTNSLKHSGASHIDIRIEDDGGRIVVSVADDGVGGIDPTKGSGLRGLRERVRGCGGSLSTIGPPGGPTVVTLELPVEATALSSGAL
ncbi:Histidine kinase-, DNA gyrase B-, and HSP90-like ATPase [Agreia bicolorata]|uniref:histidine kinase n=1 Tax=Agreia bicolorata TaxID=110935 RepID=A0A1T4WSJ3_9MICO|nr:sensor domain-containing protein [Agreia bicolorata]SKA79808.1 Histidine kinase-, DNA gyrase B-, and HSP90-like ATPase [Agreia bicolorata]